MLRIFQIIGFVIGSSLALHGQKIEIIKNVESFYGDSTITNTRVGYIYLCDTLEILKEFSIDTVLNKKGLSYWFELTVNDDTVLAVSCESNRKISSIFVNSSSFKLSNGIHVGMRISELLELYPKLEIFYWHAGTYEHCFLPDYPQIVLALKSDDGKRLGRYLKENQRQYSTRNFDTSGEIIGIELIQQCY